MFGSIPKPNGPNPAPLSGKTALFPKIASCLAFLSSSVLGIPLSFFQ